MAFQISPAVDIREIDLTTIVPQISTTAVGNVGAFRWGPLNEVVLVDSEDNLVQNFGKPDTNTAKYFFVASNILSYGNRLRLVRVCAEATAKNSTADGSGLLIKNDVHYTNSYSAGQGAVGLWAGKYASSLGNGLKVSFCHKTAFARTMTCSSTGTALTGTNFTTNLAVGSVIKDAGGNTRSITAIGGATSATLSSAFPVDLSSATVTAYWEYYQDFGFAPGTSVSATRNGSSNDEIHVIVVDTNGLFSGIRNQVLEKYAFVSVDATAKKEDGSSNYYAQVINETSKYIRWMDHSTAGTNWGTAGNSTVYTDVPKPETYTLAGGVDGNTLADADLLRGFDLFKNDEEIDVSLIACGAVSATVASYVIQNICEVRKDCIALVSPQQSDVVNASGSEVTNSITFRNSLPSSSYGVLDSGWKYQYDRYNDVYRWIPLNGDIAGLCVKTDLLLNSWNSPAGLNRGGVKNIVKLAYSPSKAQRDDLYSNSINPVVSFRGQGVVLFGDKTLLTKPSAFDRINVRRLFIVLEKSIATMAKYSLFELNTAFTRQRFVNIVEPYLREVKARQGVYDFKVRCDETNNTGEVIDRNEFVADIFIKPTRSINYITLNFVATRTDASFQEIISSGIQF